MQICFMLALVATWVGALSLLGPWLALALIVPMLALALAASDVGGRRTTLIAVTAGLLVAAATSTEPATPPTDPSVEVALSGVVSSLRCDTETRCRLRLDPVVVDEVAWPRPMTVVLNHVETAPAPGDHIQLWGRLKTGRRSKNPSAFDHLRGRPAVYAQAVTEPTLVTDRDGPWLATLRARLWASLGFEAASARILYRALLLGDKSELDTETRWLFQDTGTAHLLAISGLHVALLGWGFYRLCLILLSFLPRVAQGSRLPAAAAAMTGGFLTLFGCLVIPSQATTRALIFMGCVLVALAMARRASARHVLAFALAVVVLLEPTAALGPSCQLSFCAAAALILSAPDARRLDGWLQEPGRLPYWLPVYAVRPLAGLCWVNLVTFGATAPLTLAWFGQIAWSGLWVNLVAVPLMSFVVLPVGALWLLLAALVPSMALWLSPVPEVAAVGFVSLLGTVGADAPSAVVGAWPIWSGVLGASGVVLVLARRPTWGGALVAASILVAACLPVGGGPPGEWRTTFLDVGHGDAIAIQTPTGATMLVDAGGTWQGGDADRRLADRAVLPALLAMGWQRLDRLVISHADRDHIAGALPIAQRLPVGQLWLPPCAITDWRAKQLMDHVVARGGSVHVLHQGSTSRWQGLKIETLWPPFDARTPDGSCRWSANEGSLVLRLSAHGRSLLLTGDIEADAEATLVESREALAADVLKVAHHGSKSSSTDVFIAAVGADHAVVSGLPGRLPMPPHPVVLNRLSETATVWVTGTQGAVTMRVQADGAFEMSALSQESRDQLRDLLRRLKRREVTGLEDLGKDAP